MDTLATKSVVDSRTTEKQFQHGHQVLHWEPLGLKHITHNHAQPQQEADEHQQELEEPVLLHHQVQGHAHLPNPGQGQQELEEPVSLEYQVPSQGHLLSQQKLVGVGQVPIQEEALLLHLMIIIQNVFLTMAANPLLGHDNSDEFITLQLAKVEHREIFWYTVEIFTENDSNPSFEIFCTMVDRDLETRKKWALVLPDKMIKDEEEIGNPLGGQDLQHILDRPTS